MYTQTSIEAKYGVFYFSNENSVYRLVLLDELSQRVAPPCSLHLLCASLVVACYTN